MPETEWRVVATYASGFEADFAIAQLEFLVTVEERVAKQPADTPTHGSLARAHGADQKYVAAANHARPNTVYPISGILNKAAALKAAAVACSPTGPTDKSLRYQTGWFRPESPR